MCRPLDGSGSARSLTSEGGHNSWSIGVTLIFIGQRLAQGQRHWRGEAAVLPEWGVQRPDVADTLRECQGEARS